MSIKNFIFSHQLKFLYFLVVVFIFIIVFFVSHSVFAYSGTRYYATTNGTTDITPSASFYSVCNSSFLIGDRNDPPDNGWGNLHSFYSSGSGSIGITAWSHSHNPGGTNHFMLGCDGSGSFTDPQYYILYDFVGGVITTTAPPTCSDGIQNQDETAIDFGGICPETETISSDITTLTTWDRSHLYLVSGDIEVTSGHTLTIEPGTIVKFDTATPSSLTINGNLVAEGDTGDDHSLGKIFFTSSKDDSLLGLDTNSDGNSTSPTAGDWGGISIGSGGSASFDFAVVRYAGATGTSEAQIYNDGGTLTMEHSDVVHGTTYGIKNSSGTSDISSTDIGFNDYGFYLAGGTASVTADNVIHDNSSYGIYNNTVSSIDAEDNYWGDPTGPYQDSSNLFGLGNAVSDYVDFDPWTDNKHYITNELFDCSGLNSCTSVYDNELRWKNVDATSYATQVSAALSTWNALANVTFTEDNSTPALEFYKVNRDDVAWKGKLDFGEDPDYLNLNSYYLDDNTSSQIQNTITHELGHALGLWHSYTGNVMYFNQTSQTTLGPQDLSDYYYLWP